MLRVADQSFHPHGRQHQDHSECGGNRGGWSLGIASSRIVGTHNQFPALGCCFFLPSLSRSAGEWPRATDSMDRGRPHGPVFVGDILKRVQEARIFVRAEQERCCRAQRNAGIGENSLQRRNVPCNTRRANSALAERAKLGFYKRQFSPTTLAVTMQRRVTTYRQPVQRGRINRL